MRYFPRWTLLLLATLIMLQPLGYASGARPNWAEPTPAPATPRPGTAAPAITQGNRPGISLEKTVGIHPTLCAEDDTLVLPPGGGPVTYCYTVRNTGAMTLTRHNLTDSGLGPILNNYAFILAPGASAALTQTTTITEDTVNTAGWVAYNPGPADVVTATAAATVTLAVPSIDLIKTVGLNPTVCASRDRVRLPLQGGNVTFCYTVRNTGGITLTEHNLSDSLFGPVLTDYDFILGPGVSGFITQSAAITTSLTTTATWVANNPGPTDVVTATDTAQVDLAALLYLPMVARDEETLLQSGER